MPEKNILTRIRKALEQPTPKPFPHLNLPDSLYERMEEDLDLLFAEELIKLGGQFIYCESDGPVFSQCDGLGGQSGAGSICTVGIQYYKRCSKSLIFATAVLGRICL